MKFFYEYFCQSPADQLTASEIKKLGAQKATEEQQNAMRGQAGAIAELARDLEGTTEILRRLKLLLEDRSQTLDEEMAEIQVHLFV